MLVPARLTRSAIGMNIYQSHRPAQKATGFLPCHLLLHAYFLWPRDVRRNISLIMELKHTISKFWPRVGALLIDFIILGFFGFTLGMTFESFFVSIEHQGLLIGLIVALIYFTLGNSSVFKGQTIGKKALDIKTINASGSALSIKNSFFRSFILITPYFLINYPIPGVAYLSVIDIIKGSFFNFHFNWICSNVYRQ